MVRAVTFRAAAFGLAMILVGCAGVDTTPPSGGPATATGAVLVSPVASAMSPPSRPPATIVDVGPTPAPTDKTASPGPAATFLVYDPNADPKADIDAALAKARTDGRPVLLDFGADWCPDCLFLSAYLESPEGRKRIGSKAHVVRIDVGGFDKNLDVVSLYGDAIWKGIPAVVVLRPDGTIAATTADGALANASQMTKAEVLDFLGKWVP